MNRTTEALFVAILLVAAPGRGQEPAGKPESSPQSDPIEAIVAGIRAAEGRAKSVRAELATKGALPNGVEFRTTGMLHVLRGEQSKVRTSVACTFGNGLEARFETAETADGITIYEDDPVFGEVLVQVSKTLVADLRWAGEVLSRTDLPGMHDARSEAPLGSAMVEGLRPHFAMQPGERKDRGGEAGVWLVGARRPGLDDQDPDLPIATRVEVFVRQSDQAVLEVVHYQGEKVVHHVEVKRLEVDVEIPAPTFLVDARGLKPRDALAYPPMSEQIERALTLAERKAGSDVVRPSRRK